MREPDPEEEAAAGDRLDGERLLGQDLGVAAVDRDHAGTELDARDPQAEGHEERRTRRS